MVEGSWGVNVIGQMLIEDMGAAESYWARFCLLAARDYDCGVWYGATTISGSAQRVGRSGRVWGWVVPVARIWRFDHEAGPEVWFRIDSYALFAALWILSNSSCCPSRFISSRLSVEST